MPSSAPEAAYQIDSKASLEKYLQNTVLPRVDVETKNAEFFITPLGQKRQIYLYHERKTGALLICKFYGNRHNLSLADRQTLLNIEYSNLHAARRLGFRNPPNQVVRPLGKSKRHNSVLVEEFVQGHDLDYYIAKATCDGQHDRLYDKLTKLGHFLAELHNRTAGTREVTCQVSSEYFRRVVGVLFRDNILDSRQTEHLEHLCAEWEKDIEANAGKSVVVHGDVTPTNFIFDQKKGVTAIDLENMHEDDRAYDVGMLAGELKHHFALRIGNAEAAEPFMGHFLWEYCEGFSDREAAFRAITHRNRFFMALSELRIARNHWLPWEHRKWLVNEACTCLE